MVTEKCSDDLKLTKL